MGSIPARDSDFFCPSHLLLLRSITTAVLLLVMRIFFTMVVWANTIDRYIKQHSADRWLRNWPTVDWVSVEYRSTVNQVLLEHLSICRLLLNWHFTDTPMGRCMWPGLDRYSTNTQLSALYWSCISRQLRDAMPALGWHIDQVSADSVGQHYLQWTWSSQCYSLSILC